MRRLVSPLVRKRLRSFMRIRRAWWALLSLIGIFVFCMCAEFVCPCDPKAVVDPATLEKYRRPSVEREYDIKAARFSVDADGEVFDYEGWRTATIATFSPKQMILLNDDGDKYTFNKK